MSSKKPVQNPHDSLFKVTFSDPAETASFLQAYLPTDLVQQLDWTTLEFVGFNYLDDALESSASDILFKIQTLGSNDAGNGTGNSVGLVQEILLYLLFEHQSSPDKWMGFRFLKYENRIWDELFKQKPTPKRLVPIVPIVFYQGEKSWPYETHFSTVFTDEEITDLGTYGRFIPDFEYILIDHSDIDPAKVKGSLKARITQMLMWAAYHQPIQEALEIAARLLAQLPPSVGLNYLNIYVRYLSSTQDEGIVTNFVETAQGQPVNIGGKMVTAIEVWMQEQFLQGETEGRIKGERRGELKGKLKGKLEGELKTKISMIETILQTNPAWDTITQLTKIDQRLFKFMKDIYNGLFAEPASEGEEIEVDTEYIQKRRVMVVNVLHYRFQLSDEQQATLLEKLTSFEQKEQLDELVDRALIIEEFSLFHDKLDELTDPISLAEAKFHEEADQWSSYAK